MNQVLILSYQAKFSIKTAISGVVELGDDFAQFIMYFQWFRPPIHPAFVQRPILLRCLRRATHTYY
jgi:hypothetical protein